MTRFLVGLDPSFSNTGIVILDSLAKTIFLTSHGSEIGQKTYANLFSCVQERCNSITRIIKEHVGDASCQVISETPPANGSFSSGLFGLDIHLHSVIKSIPNCTKVYGLAPTYLGHLHGTRAYKKSASVALAKDILEEFSKLGYSIELARRLSADMAEAFLFLVRLYVVNVSDSISSYLLSRHVKYFDKKEFEL